MKDGVAEPTDEHVKPRQVLRAALIGQVAAQHILTTRCHLRYSLWNTFLTLMRTENQWNNYNISFKTLILTLTLQILLVCGDHGGDNAITNAFYAVVLPFIFIGIKNKQYQMFQMYGTSKFLNHANYLLENMKDVSLQWRVQRPGKERETPPQPCRDSMSSLTPSNPEEPTEKILGQLMFPLLI